MWVIQIKTRDEVRRFVIHALLSRSKLHWIARSWEFLVVTVLNKIQLLRGSREKQPQSAWAPSLRDVQVQV